MTYEIYPVKLEIFDEDVCYASVETFDTSAASVTIKQIINANEWPELAEAIHQALKACKLDGDVQ